MHDPSRPTFPPSIESTLIRLHEARAQAELAAVSLWERAIDVGRLLIDGLTLDDFHWLARIRWIALGHEITEPDDQQRSFAHWGKLTDELRWLAVITDQGERALGKTRGLRDENYDEPLLLPVNGDGDHDVAVINSSPPVKPVWNSQSRKLLLLGHLVKRFRGQAPNQVTVLAAFQEEGWPDAIDDPLPTRDELDPKRRLHDTIKCLNRNQSNALLRFRGNGTGEMVTWEADMTRLAG